MPIDPQPPGLQVVVPYGPAGSSARVRALDWLRHTGRTATVHDYLGLSENAPRLVLSTPAAAASAERNLWALSRQVSDDTVFLVREASPFSRGHVERALLRRAGRSVYDFDDALMVQEPGIIARVFSKVVKWRRCIQAADVVVAGNPLLAEQAEAAGARDVRIVPSCVEPNDYRTKTDFDRTGPPRALWLGSPATEHYLTSVATPLLHAHRTHGLRLTVISAGDRTLGELDRIVDRIAWTPRAAERLADADFGIMPLPDDPWTRGKCAYKLLQYGAAGLPMVGAGVGANVAALTVMGGLAANTAVEWSDALEALAIADEATAADLGRRALAGVTEHYSFAAWAPTWLDAVGATG